MGRHASTTQSRGLARWIIVAVVVLVAAVLVTVGYIVVVNRSDAPAETLCTSAVSLPVAAGPDAAPALSRAAIAYNATAPVVRSTCVITTVTGVADNEAIDGLTGRWRTSNGPAPGLWIADSAASLATLDAIDPGFTAGHATEPIAWSPVVLAVAAADADAVPELSWRGVATAMGVDSDGATVSGADRLELQLAPVGPNRSVSYAIQSMLSVSGPTSAVTEADVTEQRELIEAVGVASVEADSVARALESLSSSGGTRSGAVAAVPAIEAAVARAVSGGAEVAAVHPRGVTVGDALIPAPISAEWTNRTMIAAAADFTAFLMSPSGQQILADGGWRTVSAHPDEPLPQVDTTTQVTMRPAGGPVVDAAIAAALGQPLIPVPNTPLPTDVVDKTSTTTAPQPSDLAEPPATTGTSAEPPTTATTEVTTTEPDANVPNEDGPVLTIVIDTSEGMSTEQDGKSLLRWVQEAMPEIFDGAITDRIGLWAYADSETYPPSGAPRLVSTGALSGEIGIPAVVDPDADEDEKVRRSQALVETAAALTPLGERWAYAALMEVYGSIAETAVDGRETRILFVTSGEDDTPGTPRRMVLDSIRAVDAQVRLDVLGLGSAVPVDAYTDIAATGGGGYIPVTDPSKLTRIITDLLAPEEPDGN